jgi:hypothetical protein
MMRALTVLIVLFSMLSGPVASAVCMDCCNRSVEHRLPLCHDKGHAHLGRHAHHINHVHMVTRDSEASIVIDQCDQQFQDSRVNCRNSVCLSARQVQALVAPAPAHVLQVSSQLLSSSISNSHVMAASGHPPGTASVPSLAASAPLRI